ncbi:MAG: type II secretion system inner membrane protein GspF [Smithellaceae bacterium]|nr:type II secretion system inner membrane protein GspF [Smithellaceae bacterium]
MPVYEYSALDVKGRRLKGITDAVSLAAARQKLREQEIYPVEISEASSDQDRKKLTLRGSLASFSKVGLREVALMTRQLATLLGAGLPLVQSLSALVVQARHPQLKKTLAQIREEVNEGNSFTDSISHFPAIFPPFYVNMVRAGEASGTIDLVLERLADFSESQQRLITKIRSALAYPILMFIIGSMALIALLTFVVPNITKIFSEMHQSLPVITILLIAISGFLKSFWWIIAVVIAAAVIGTKYAVGSTSRGAYLWDEIKLKLPLWGVINQKIAMARFSRTLGTLLQSGVPLLTALDIVKNVVNNRLIADAIGVAAKDVEEGQGLSLSLAKEGMFPPITLEMISVGEQSGNLEGMLYRIADAYETEVEANILLMTSLLEPLMILVMGLAVGFIVISILLPIFEMNQLVR